LTTGALGKPQPQQAPIPQEGMLAEVIGKTENILHLFSLNVFKQSFFVLTEA
jgi:hypothetical protein